MLKMPKRRWKTEHVYGGYTIYRDNNKWYWQSHVKFMHQGPFRTLKKAKQSVEKWAEKEFDELRRECDPTHPEYRRGNHV